VHSTQRGDTVFVPVLEWNDPVLALPAWGRRVLSARMLDGGAAVDVQQSPAGITLTLPRSPANVHDRVVMLVVGSKAKASSVFSTEPLPQFILPVVHDDGRLVG
jgi:hypothetical protein